MRISLSRLSKFGACHRLQFLTARLASYQSRPVHAPNSASKSVFEAHTQRPNYISKPQGPLSPIPVPNMGRSLRAARVLQTARNSIGNSGEGGRVIRAPVWLKALERLPPAEILTRPKPIPHHDPNPRMRKPRNIFKPQRIIHPEDELRQTFFKDHPWELARPRIAVELDGKDAQYLDWSTGLQQPGMQVTGES